MNNKSQKKIIYQIMKEEITEHNVDVTVLPLTSLENIINILSTGLRSQPRNLKELIIIFHQIKEELHVNNKGDAYYDNESNKLKIILKRKKHLAEHHLIWNLIKNIYHEYKHTLLEKLVKKPFVTTKEDVFFAIENLFNPTSDFHLTYHDDFYEEILANNYGIKKAEQFLKRNSKYAETYKKLINTIELDKILHQIYYRNYDFRLILAKINQKIKDNISEINYFSNDKELEIIRILYNKSGKFKSLKELFETESWNKISIEAQYLIVSSEAYLPDIDYKNSTNEELYFILDALSYALTLEYERPKYNQEFRTRLESISRTLNAEDLGEQNLYLDTLLVLNTKEESNKIKIEKLQTMINTIIAILKHRGNSPKRKVHIPIKEQSGT